MTIPSPEESFVETAEGHTAESYGIQLKIDLERLLLSILVYVFLFFDNSGYPFVLVSISLNIDF